MLWTILIELWYFWNRNSSALTRENACILEKNLAPYGPFSAQSHDDVNGVRLHLWSVATNGPVVHPSVDAWSWRTMVEWYQQGKTPNSSNRALWQSYQQSHLVANVEELGKKNYEFSLQSIFVPTSEWFFKCHKILWRGTYSFTSALKEGVLWIFIAVKNPSLQLGLNIQTLGPMASTLVLYHQGDAHSLNLVGVNAAKLNLKVVTVVRHIQILYVPFSSSPAKWAISTAEVGLSMQSPSDTCWSLCVAAICSFVHNTCFIFWSHVFTEMYLTLPEKCYSEATSLKPYFSLFECIVVAGFWFKVLSCINERNVVIWARCVYLSKLTWI